MTNTVSHYSTWLATIHMTFFCMECIQYEISITLCNWRVKIEVWLHGYRLSPIVFFFFGGGGRPKMHSVSVHNRQHMEEDAFSDISQFIGSLHCIRLSMLFRSSLGHVGCLPSLSPCCWGTWTDYSLDKCIPGHILWLFSGQPRLSPRPVSPSNILIISNSGHSLLDTHGFLMQRVDAGRSLILISITQPQLMTLAANFWWDSFKFWIELKYIIAM